MVRVGPRMAVDVATYGALGGLHGSGKIVGTWFGSDTEEPSGGGVDDRCTV